MDLLSATAVEIREAVSSGKVSAREVAKAYLDRIAQVDPKVHAFLYVDPDWSLSAAEAVDKKRAAGKALGALAGVPVAIKDVLCTKGIPTTCGSRILENFKPPYAATCVRKLLAADAHDAELRATGSEFHLVIRRGIERDVDVG